MARLAAGLEADRRLMLARLRIPVALLVFALVYGTAGYMVVAGFGLLDAAYMTVTTLTTVGFGEIRPLGPAGRLFTMSLIAVGVLAVFGLIAELTTLLAGGQLNRFLDRRSMQGRIADLRDHYVICAYGRVGRAAAHELVEQGADVVVVESKTELEPLLVEAGLPYVLGDSTVDSVLEAAGIRRANGLLCAVDSDAVNVYITLTARALSADLFIISRASSPESVDKLFRAGSDRVISPYSVSGARMAAMALRPAMLEFVDMVSVAPDLRVEELAVGRGSRLGGRTVQDVCSPYEGVMMLAVKKSSGELVVPPRATTVVDEGSVDALGSLAREAG